MELFWNRRLSVSAALLDLVVKRRAFPHSLSQHVCLAPCYDAPQAITLKRIQQNLIYSFATYLICSFSTVQGTGPIQTYFSHISTKVGWNKRGIWSISLTRFPKWDMTRQISKTSYNSGYFQLYTALLLKYHTHIKYCCFNQKSIKSTFIHY